jgi:AcrR family transcriptional regulator
MLAAMATASHPSPRKDARRNREAILAAARELFATSGDVPMYEIARRAGVGQATLYRHFPERGALVLALFEEQLEGLERLAAGHAGEPTAFFALLRAVVQAQVQFHGMVECMRGEPGGAGDQDRLKERFCALVRGPLRDAQAAGHVRRDLGLDEVFLVIAMVSGALGGRADPAASAATGRRALALVVEGLAGPARPD